MEKPDPEEAKTLKKIDKVWLKLRKGFMKSKKKNQKGLKLIGTVLVIFKHESETYKEKIEEIYI